MSQPSRTACLNIVARFFLGTDGGERVHHFVGNALHCFVTLAFLSKFAKSLHVVTKAVAGKHIHIGINKSV
jgi:hypothetical protein